MKRTLHYIALIVAIALIFAAVQISRHLPADTRTLVEKKYSGWSGVLRGWICSEWSCAGSFTSWLNSAAAEFEKNHEGVFLEFTSVSAQAMLATDVRPPDMLIFSHNLIPMDAEPFARGGYVLVENPDAAGTVIPEAYAPALIAMGGGTSVEVEESGLELGLPVSNVSEQIMFDENAFRRFRNGEVGRTVVNQAELGQLIALRDSGRGPDWRCVVRGGYNWYDQTLLLGIKTRDEQKAQLCREFLQLLLSGEMQRGLSAIGAFSVTGISAYPEHSAYRAMEEQILFSQAIFPKSEHSAPDAAAIIREINLGQMSMDAAARILAQTVR